MTKDKRWQAKFAGFVSRSKHFLSLKNCLSVRICSVLNRSNRDTTVYYRLILCAFSWPNEVKWHHSGIIKKDICAHWVEYREIVSNLSRHRCTLLCPISLMGTLNKLPIPFCCRIFSNNFNSTAFNTGIILPKLVFKHTLNKLSINDFLVTLASHQQTLSVGVVILTLKQICICVLKWINRNRKIN